MAIMQGRSQQEKRTGAPVVPSKNAGHVADGTTSDKIARIESPSYLVLETATIYIP